MSRYAGIMISESMWRDVVMNGIGSIYFSRPMSPARDFPITQGLEAVGEPVLILSINLDQAMELLQIDSLIPEDDSLKNAILDFLVRGLDAECYGEKGGPRDSIYAGR